jgi:HD-like signal output (HDOD) protein
MHFLKRSPRPTIQPQSHSLRTPGSSDAGDDYLSYIHAICPTRNIAAGEYLLERQPSIDNLYMVVKGTLDFILLTTHASYNTEVSKGKLLGFIPERSEYRLSYTVAAKSPSVIVEVTKRTFDSLHSEVKRKIYENLYQEMLNIFPQAINESFSASHNISQLSSYIHAIHMRNKEHASSELIQNIIKKIPKIPSHTYNILSKLMSDDVSAQEITESIQKDSSLVGIILKTVNSSYYGLSQKISDVHHAIIFLGFNNIYQLILNQSIKNIIDGGAGAENIQTHSTLISILAHQISTLSKKSKPMTMMATGLLHDIGKSVIFLLKNKYPNVQDLFEMLDDAALGSALLQSWGLPEQIFQVVENHRMPEFCPPEHLQGPYKEDIAILYVAHVYHDLLLRAPPVSTIYLHEYLSLLGAPSHNSVQYYEDALRSALMKNLSRLPAMARTLLQDTLPPL